ncbi:MAG TPA: adenylyltransferase/cytidyltransferase family protein [Methylomirabilota bacterium]|nr:adenylyltransferase/cytidyltransferase family protein [Methylomirabilota bacterium]
MTAAERAAKEPVGVVHGRFQPLHLGHLEYLLAARRTCRVLVVGITNPDPWQTAFEPTDPGRGSPAANPCTYYERHLMVEGALRDHGVKRGAFRIIPFPHGHPERLRHYLPPDALLLLTVYDAWGETKLERFRRLGLRVRVLWRRQEKVTSGSRIRTAIQEGRPWEHLVPAATARVIRRFGIDDRIQRLAAGEAAAPGHEEVSR